MDSLLLLIIPVHALACLSPGPDSLLTLRNTLVRGAAAGYATLGGILTGVSTHIVLAIGGLSLLASQHPLILRFIALAGALYFFYLGVRSLRPLQEEEVKAEKAAGRRFHGGPFAEGLLTNLLNAKAILYFLSIFSITLGAESGTGLRLQAGAIMVVTQLVGYSALIEGARFFRAKALHRSQRTLDRIAGVAFLFFALVAGTFALGGI